jgi:hypothetical protein
MDRWTKSNAIAFGLSVATFEFVVSLAGSYLDNYTIAIRSLDFSISTKLILLLGATLVPAVFCFFGYSEPRAAISKSKAGLVPYIVAISAGLIPLLSYVESRYPVFPWGRPVAMWFLKYIGINILLAPLWGAIIWQGCFLQRIKSFCSVRTGIVVMSMFATIGSAGQIAFLYSNHYPVEVLAVLSLTYFCLWMILGSVFELGGQSLWPCVLLMVIFNASSAIYFVGARSAELRSYIAELFFVATFAAVLLRFAGRQPITEAEFAAQA